MKDIFYRIYIFFFAKTTFLRFNRFVLTLGLKGLGLNNYESMNRSGEVYFLKWVKKNLDPKTIFDIGANEGSYAAFCLDLEMKSILCFEPVKDTYQRLNTRYNSTKSVQCYNFGFSNIAETKTIYDMSEKGTCHATLYPEMAEFDGFTHKQTINLDTIDNFCLNNDIKHIGLLKIDTEGHEFSILQGAKNMLSNKNIDVIHFEFNRHNIYSRNFLKDFMEIMNGYVLYRLLPKSFLKINYDRPEMEELFFFQNIIAIRKDKESLIKT